jgi:hypothetical protein
MCADTPSIAAPPFPRNLPWVNAAMVRMDQQRGKVVLVEFWDFCRVNSLRTLPYLQAWHAKYADLGLRIIGVHTGAFPPSREEAAVRIAVERLEIPWPVVIDTNLEVWDIYGNEGWPARYLWDPDLNLHSMHYGEGAYAETEREIQSLLGVSLDLVPPLRPEDDPAAMIATPTADVDGPYSGVYEAGGVWVVVSGSGDLRINDDEVFVDLPGCFEIVHHGRHTRSQLVVEPGPGVTVHATCFTPGVA